MKTNKYKKYIWLSLLVLSLLLPSAVALAQATPAPAPGAPPSQCSFPDIFGNLIECSLNGIGNVFLTIGAFIGMILAWAVSFILGFGMDIVNSPPVQAGFGVTLSIANLGFVLAIIIIAIATILRLERYGIKALLAKVVIMAVLINFGLVLSGIVLSFSDSVTNYFLEGVTGTNSATGVTGAYVAFRDKLGTAFQPNKFVDPTTKMSAAELAATTQSLSGLATGKASSIMVSFSSMLMSIVGTVLIDITLAAFVIMLVIRYVTLVILLVLLPLAWMANVFPSLSKHFHDWLSSFIKQLIFPPVALFFLWLSLTISQATITLSGTDPLVSSLGKTSPLASLLIGPLFNVVILSGLMLGGLMAAQKLGAAGADRGMGWAKSLGGKVGGGARGYAGRVTRRAATAPLRNKATQDFAQSLMKGESFLSRIPGAKVVGRGIAAYSRTGGAGLVKTYEDRYKGMDKAQLLEELRASPLGNSPQSRAAIFKGLQQKGGLGDLTEKEVNEYIVGQKKTFRDVGAEGIYKDLEKNYGPESMRLALSAMKTNPGAIMVDEEGVTGEGNKGGLVPASEIFTASTKKFVGGLDKEGAKKVSWSQFFGGKADPQVSNEMIKQLVDMNSSVIPSISGKMSGDTKNDFTEKLESHFKIENARLDKEQDDLIAKSGGKPATGDDEKLYQDLQDKKNKLTEKRRKIEKSMDLAAAMGEEEGGEKKEEKKDEKKADDKK